MRLSPRPASPSGIAACTIISKNYLSYARVLADSFLQNHAGIPFVVLLVDELGSLDPERERFHLVELRELAIPDVNRFCFQYSPIELNTAVKPYFLSHLFAKYGFDRLVYFDPDILVLRNLAPLFALLQDHPIVLTPHLTAPLPQDGRTPDEVAILRAGTYNLGFIALANHATTRRMVAWWQERLYTGSQMDPDRGLHVDQKWIDLIPGFFPDVCILKDPGYNVAYWNLATRRVEVNDGAVTVNGQPAFFFHFSGIDPDNLQAISKHSNRFNLDNVGPAAVLYTRYVDLLRAYGYDETKNQVYAFGHFDNGLRIPDAARRLYLKLGEEAHQFGNPFDTAGPSSYFSWLNASPENSADPSQAVSRLWHQVYDSRPEVQRTFPDIQGAHREAFLRWTVDSGLREHDIPDRFAAGTIKQLVKSDSAGRRGASGAGREFGVNVAGHLTSEKGVGEAVRSAVRVLEAAGIPYVLNNSDDPGARNVDTSFTRFSEHNPYKFNLIVLGSEEVAQFVRGRGEEYFLNRRNIGHLAWELEDFPRESLSSLGHFDEIWVASSFIQTALASVSSIPIVRVPYSVSCHLPLPIGHRLRFGLPKDAFVFLFIFDFHSIVQRKNPLGLIEAFRRAFSEKEDVLLILKFAHSESAEAELKEIQAKSKAAHIRITDAALTRDQIRMLMHLSDCYVSLHRAEGFGVTLAEAMALEKPVIATGYSGNMDFMTRENSLPVRYELVPIERDYGPYKRGFVWADPDTDHAAELMRWVYENREAARALGRQARQDILGSLTAESVAKMMKERLLS